ncbi:unnamed protein product [Closterium sp. NIES-53]
MTLSKTSSCGHSKGGARPGEGGRPRTCSRSGTKYGLGRSGPPEPTGTAPVPPVVAPVPAAPPAPTAPTPAGPAAPVPPAAPAVPPAGPTPVPTAPVPPVRAPPGPVVTGGPPAPAARLQRRAKHSRSSCGERSSRLDEALREATRADLAPPGSAPPDSAPPDAAPPDSAPPSSAPLDSAPPDPAPIGSAPLAALDSTATLTGSTASTWDTPDGARP